MELMTRQTKIIEHHCCHLLDNDQLARKEEKKKIYIYIYIFISNTKAAKQFINHYFKTVRNCYDGNSMVNGAMFSCSLNLCT